MEAQNEKPLIPPPSGMSRAGFVARFGGIYERSAWVAERVFEAGLTPQHDTVAGLAGAMAGTVAAAEEARRLTLVRAHPDLAGKAAIAGDLTAESRSEQATAGLDQLTRDEFSRFQALNSAYRTKFGFPFIIAVSGLNKTAILAAFERRIRNDPAVEFEEALRQIDRIALKRLSALAGG